MALHQIYVNLYVEFGMQSMVLLGVSCADIDTVDPQLSKTHFRLLNIREVSVYETSFLRKAWNNLLYVFEICNENLSDTDGQR